MNKPNSKEDSMQLKEESFLFGVVVSKVPVWDFLRLQTAASGSPSSKGEGGFILDGKVKSTIDPVLIAARAFASNVGLDKYLSARAVYLGKRIEDLNGAWNSNYSDHAYRAVEQIESERAIFVAEEAMLKTIVNVLADHHEE